MRTLTLTIPDNLELDDREVAVLLAAKLYEQGKLSLGQGAELAGYSKRTFMELLGRYNVPIFNYNPSELANDIKNAGNYYIGRLLENEHYAYISLPLGWGMFHPFSFAASSHSSATAVISRSASSFVSPCAMHPFNSGISAINTLSTSLQ